MYPNRIIKRNAFYVGSLLAVVALLMLGGCKKAVDNAQTNALLDLITTGQWVVTRFEVGAEDKLSEYTPYTFQFFRNGQVAARQSGQPDVVGTWNPIVENLSIQSAFNGAGLPLTRFNGTWSINRTTMTTVEASREEGGVLYRLGLRSL